MGAEVMEYEHGAALQSLKEGREYHITHQFKGMFTVRVDAVTVSCVPLKSGGEREMVWVHATRVHRETDRPTRKLRSAHGERVILMGLLVRAARRAG